MGKRTLSTGLAVVALSTFTAGCGGDSTETASQPLTPAAFVTKAKRICAEARKEIQNALVKYQRDSGPLDPSDVGDKAVAVTLLPVQHRETARLETLAAPEGSEKRYEEFLDARNETLAEIEKRNLSSNSELFRAFERSDQMARGLQLQECTFG